MTYTVAFAVVAMGVIGPMCLLGLGVFWHRRFGRAGLGQFVAGQLIVVGALEVSGYEALHGWLPTHRYAALLWIPVYLAGLACVCWGSVVAHSSKQTPGRAVDN